MRTCSVLLVALLSSLPACRSTPSAVAVPIPPPERVEPPPPVAPLPVRALNDTGQSRCYDGFDLLGCSMESTGDYAEFPRQDGRFGRDAQRLGFDFEGRDATGGPVQVGAKPACVQDRTTGLLWLAAAVPAHPWGELSAAVAAANSGKPCGRSDWRLPSRHELVSIVDYGQANPALDRRFFPAGAPVPHWTGDPGAQDPSRAWLVQLSDGASYVAEKQQAHPALLVAGAASPAPAYQVQGDGTVRDARTGLLWDRCSLGQSGETCEVGAADKLPWDKALAASVQANKSRYKGHDDWRLPNVKELESLTDVRRFDPAIDPAFPRTAKYWCWTATPRPGDPVEIWDVGFDDAHLGFGSDVQYGHVRLVRNGDGYDAMGK
jgi:hypothetical protein